MRHLGRWVAPEEANAESALVSDCGKCLGTDHRSLNGLRLAEMPVLAEQTVSGAAFVKDSQVMVSILLAAITYPVRDTVGRQRISVPVQKAALRRSRNMIKPVIVNFSQTAESAFALRDAAFIAA